MKNQSDFEFLHAVWSRRAVFTYVFFAINIALFILMALAGGSTTESTLIAFGAKSNALIDAGEIWRFVTPVFIHIGLLHLFFNSYALWIVGPQVEKLYGSPRFVILYVLTGIAGVAGSVLYNPYALSAGASGAIFGLFGVLLVFGWRNRHTVPPSFRRAVGSSVLPIIVINLIIGFSIPQIDNAAHLAGLIAGMVLAAVVPFESLGEEPSPGFGMLQYGLIMVVAASFVMVALRYDGPALSVRNLGQGFGFSGGSGVGTFIGVINNSERTFSGSLSALQSGDVAGVSGQLPAVAEAIDALDRIPSLAARQEEITDGLLGVMQDQYGLLQDVQRAGTVTFSHGREAARNRDRYRDLMNELTEWVDAEGERYGIQLRSPR